jgi:hypothetical protein
MVVICHHRSVGFYPVKSAGIRMCEKCGPINKKIEQLRQLAGPGSDLLSLALIRATVDSLKAERASFKCAGGSSSPGSLQIPIPPPRGAIGNASNR